DPLAALLLQERVVVAAAEHLHVDDRALYARRDLEGLVLHVLGLLAEDCREELLLGGELVLALVRDLANEDVARLVARAYADDAALVQVREALLRDVRDLARDLLHPALRVPDVELELLDVDGRVGVLLDQPLADDDRVLEVVTVPGHERDDDVAPERELAVVRRGAVGDDVTRLDALALVHERALVDGRVLVRPPELREPVAVVLGELGQRLVALARLDRAGVDDDLVRRDALDDAAPAREDHGARVAGDLLLEPGADERRLRVEQRDRLALHVRAHERAVRV